MVALAINGHDDRVDEALAPIITANTSLRWSLRNGLWAFGAGRVSELIRTTPAYTLQGVADRIACPTLVLEAENDHTFAGEAGRVAAALRCPHRHVQLRDAEGAGEHCHEGAMLRFHRLAFDWLNCVMPLTHDRVTLQRSKRVDRPLHRLTLDSRPDRQVPTNGAAAARSLSRTPRP